MSERSKRAEGFTLIELVIVTAMIALLMAISYPLLEHWTEGVLRKGARQLTATIEQLYERAVTTRQIYRLVLEVGEGRYRSEILNDSKGFTEFQPNQELPSGVRIRDLVDGRHEKVTSGEAAIYFYPIGRLDPVVVHLERRGQMGTGEILSLLPHPVTGRVAITAGEVEFQSSPG